MTSTCVTCCIHRESRQQKKTRVNIVRWTLFFNRAAPNMQIIEWSKQQWDLSLMTTLNVPLWVIEDANTWLKYCVWLEKKIF